MILATTADRERVLEILLFSFEENPGVNALLRPYARRFRLRKLLEYSVDYALRRKGLYLSNDKNSVAICYNFHASRENFRDWLGKVKLVIKAIRVVNIFKILKHLSYIKKSKPAYGNFLYFWYLGANEEAAKESSTKKLIIHLFKMAREKGMDIYAETTLLRNRLVYERFGFTTFKHWHNQDLKLSVWFMLKRCIPKTVNS